jgi:pimeloyl-ACP methyl ester carboxylesterase
MKVHEPASLAAGTAGGGLPVVALHSSASTSGQWKSLAAHFAGRRLVITPDLLGYGVAAEAAESRKAANLASEATAVLQSIGGVAPAFHLVGHSYGGAVALKLALRYPHRVRSLTLIEPVAFHLLLRSGSDADMRHYRTVLGIRDRVRGAVAAGWPAYGMAAFVDFWNGAGSWDALATEQRQRLAGQVRAVQQNFAAVLDETWPLGELASLAMPVLTVDGSRSPAVTQRLVEIITGAARHAATVRICGAGHMAPLTHAAAINGLIERQLRLAEGAEIKPAAA